MNEKTTICFVLTGVKYSQSDLGKHYKTFCGLYVEHAETRVLNMSRPGCHTMPFRISVFSFSFPLFSFARMRIYYNVSLLSGFSSSLKIYVLQHICQSAFYKKCLRKTRKNPLIYLACML